MTENPPPAASAGGSPRPWFDWTRPAAAGRAVELDFMKVLSIAGMFFMHLQIVFFSRDYADYAFLSAPASWAGLNALLSLCGPFIFVFSMGATLVFSRNQDGAARWRRGWRLLAAWLALNVLRGIPYALTLAGIAVPFPSALTAGASPFIQWLVFYLFVNDILFFAGVFFLFLGGLQKLGLRPRTIALAAVTLFAAANAAGDFSPHLPDWSRRWLGGLVYSGDAYSSFPFANWAVVPFLGMGWGHLLRHCRRPGALHAAAGAAGAVAAGAAGFLMWQKGMLAPEYLQAHMLNPLDFHRMNGVSLGAAVAGNAVLLAAVYGVSRVCGEFFRKGVVFCASLLFPVYFVHWVLLAWAKRLPQPPPGAPYGLGGLLGATALFYALSVALAAAYKRLTSRRAEKK